MTLRDAIAPVVTWHGAYDANWRDLITPESFAHPAKMARGLVERIFDELFALGALKAGDLVCDPFGGIGSTAISGAARGCRVVCCELEPRFVELGKANIELHRRDWEAMWRPIPVMVQGDSRRLRAHVGPVLAACVVASPPYEGSVNSERSGIDWDKANRPDRAGEPPKSCHSQGVTPFAYGTSPGQLGAMPSGQIDAVISSPPYATGDSASAQSISTRTDKSAAWVKANCGTAATEGYGASAGQLAEMPAGDVAAIVSSPPFQASLSDRPSSNIVRGGLRMGASSMGDGYGSSPGQLGEMPAGAVDAVVSSPPYEGSLHAGQDGVDWESARRTTAGGGEHQKPGQSATAAYPTSKENIGNTRGDTFWAAAYSIVRESHAILKPGGWAVFVVKSFVRKGQLVDFPGDWRRLCEHVGFETVQEVHASLVTEETKPHLFDGERTTRRERKSFFRRLAEKKGSPRIDFETVLFMRKALAGDPRPAEEG